MRSVAIGRLLRMVRIRRAWRQSDVAIRARLSDSAVGRHQQGVIGSLRALESHAASLDLRLDLRLVGRSGQLARLVDEEHAALVDVCARELRVLGFAVSPEGSFSEWGERGRIDLLAFHSASGTLVVLEAKTLLVDLQDLFGSLDVKERLARSVARRRAWDAREVVVLLAVAATRRNGRGVAAHRALFATVPVRRMGPWVAGGRGRALVWIGAHRASRRSWLAGRERVRSGGR